MDEREEEAPTEIKNVENLPLEVSKDEDDTTRVDHNQMPSPHQEMTVMETKEEIIKKKYGGLLQKKPPLISKDNERAFFDSADWALGKKSKGPLLEALRPKLEPSPHHQARSRSPCAPADEAGDFGNGDDLKHGLVASEDEKLLDFEMEK